MKSVTCFVVVLCCFIFNSAEGTIRHVPLQYQTVQAGIDASLNGDTVLVAEGRYYENIRFMGKAIIVASNFLLDADTSHISRTIMDGSNPSDPNWASVVSFDLGEDTTSVLCGFTITGGKGSAMGYRAGGGIFCAASAKIINNIISGNTLDSTGLAGGGGIFSSGGYCIIENNRVESNVVRADGLIVGGGISSHLSDGGRILHNVISWNRSSSRAGGIAGGGIHVVANAGDTTRVTIADNRIEGNILEVAQPADACTGGGIWAATLPTITTNRSLILKVIGNDIIGNRLTNSMRSSGGGIIIQACSELSVLDKNRIIANTCTGALTNGAGLYVINSIPTNHQ